MLLVVLAVACLVSVPLRGGRLRRLGEIRLRAQWAALGALAAQVLVLGVFTGGAAWWHAVAHVATYALAAYFVWANRAIPGVVVIAIGGALNLLAIAANHGVMPTSPWAERAAGLEPTGAFANSTVLAHPHLLWLGDVLPVPAPVRPEQRAERGRPADLRRRARAAAAHDDAAADSGARAPVGARSALIGRHREPSRALVRHDRAGPIDDRPRAVLIRRQQREMHGAPRQLRRGSCHRAAAEHLDDRGPAPDGGHRALVVVAERLGFLSANW